MLTLTDSAAHAVKDAVSRSTTVDGGVRIAGAADPSAGFTLSIATAPEPTDAVVETEGARVFLDPSASVALDERTLDAQVDDQSGAVRFALT